MIKTRRTVATLLAIGATALTLSACGSVDTKATADASASNASIGTLANASTIKLHKGIINLTGDEWTVSVNGNTVGKVHGKALSYLDTYSMTTPSGDLMGFEKERLTFFLHRASVFNAQAKQVGSINESFHLLTYKEAITDDEGNTIGTMDEHIALTKHGSIVAPNGQVAWSFSKALISLSDSYTLKRGPAAAQVPVMDAVWSVMIFNEADS